MTFDSSSVRQPITVLVTLAGSTESLTYEL